MRRLLAVLIALLAFSATASSRTWYIKPDGTGDAPTIQAGIDSAHTGDVIELAPGTYRGEGNRDIEYHHAPVTVRSTTGDPEDCIIDCEGSESDPHRGFYFNLGEASTSVLEAVTVTNGVQYQGGGIRCVDSSPTINNCILVNNTAIGPMGSEGGGLHCSNGSPTIVKCVFRGNRAAGPSGGGGGAACVGYTEPVFEDCWFVGNVAEGGRGGGIGIAWQESRALVRNSVFIGNQADVQGGAVWCGANITVGFTLEGCTLVLNRAPEGSGIYYWVTSSGADTPAVDRSLVALGLEGAAISCEGSAAVVEMSCADLWENEGGDWTGCIADQYGVNGNFSADPLFCDAPAGDFTLRSDSPCLPGNHPDGADCGLIGVFGEGCSGPTAVEKTSWGAVKAMFR